MVGWSLGASAAPNALGRQQAGRAAQEREDFAVVRELRAGEEILNGVQREVRAKEPQRKQIQLIKSNAANEK